MFGKNRILQAIAVVRTQVENVSAETLGKLAKKLEMGLGEYAKFQELKSLAVANGDLSSDEGNAVYRYLGNSLDTFNSQPVEIKIVLTTLLGELLGNRLAAIRSK